MAKKSSGLIAALDVGTAKICCFIAQTDAEGALRVVGMGHQVSKGVRNGTVVDMAAVENSMRAVVHSAEEMAGETVRGVVLGVGGAQPTSRSLNIEVAIGGHEIGDADLERVRREGRDVNGFENQTLLHALPVDYAIDGVRGIHEPRGMHGDRLGVRMHVVTGNRGAIRNLGNCVARCHLEVDALVVAPYASGLACLVDDEVELGATCIDMGGGTTGISTFCQHEMVFADSLPIGGRHITHDIARGLATTISDAERLKTLHGNAITSPIDDRKMIDVPQIGEDEPTSANHVPCSELSAIVRPRIEETFELVRERLDAAGSHGAAARRVVLTGGASQLEGVRDAAGRILNRQVRLGVPMGIQGLAQSMRGPAFATCAGLLAHAQRPDSTTPVHDAVRGGKSTGRMGRFGRRLRATF